MVLSHYCSCMEGEVHASVAQAINFVVEQLAAEDGKESRPLRGPYLARLELIQRLRRRSCSQELQLGNSARGCLMFNVFVVIFVKICFSFYSDVWSFGFFFFFFCR